MELEEAKARLAECQEQLRNRDESGVSSSYLDKVCGWVTNPGKEGKAVMKKTVDGFLKATQLDQAPLDEHGDVKQVHVTVSLTTDKLLKLRRFLLTDEGTPEEMQNILDSSYALTYSSSLRSENVFQQMAWLRDFVRHDSFVICQIAALSAFVGLALWKKVKVWRVAVVVSVCSVAWTWIHLYKVALARKQATLRQLGDVPQSCLVERQGWAGAVSDAVGGALGLSSSKSKKCEAYYEALMVDPFWEVTPLRAVTETVSQLVLRPLEMCGASVGLFFSDVLAPIPLVWKLPVLAVAAAAVFFLLLMACGYRVKSPLLFSIEPASSKKTKKEKRPPKTPESLPYPTSPNMIDEIEDNALNRSVVNPSEESESSGAVRRGPWTHHQ